MPSLRVPIHPVIITRVPRDHKEPDEASRSQMEWYNHFCFSVKSVNNESPMSLQALIFLLWTHGEIINFWGPGIIWQFILTNHCKALNTQKGKFYTSPIPRPKVYFPSNPEHLLMPYFTQNNEELNKPNSDYSQTSFPLLKSTMKWLMS